MIGLGNNSAPPTRVLLAEAAGLVPMPNAQDLHPLTVLSE
jgi:hypothetical protein